MIEGQLLTQSHTVSCSGCLPEGLKTHFPGSKARFLCLSLSLFYQLGLCVDEGLSLSIQGCEGEKELVGLT